MTAELLWDLSHLFLLEARERYRAGDYEDGDRLRRESEEMSAKSIEKFVEAS